MTQPQKKTHDDHMRAIDDMTDRYRKSGLSPEDARKKAIELARRWERKNG